MVDEDSLWSSERNISIGLMSFERDMAQVLFDKRQRCKQELALAV